jgi:hypothetical protein
MPCRDYNDTPKGYGELSARNDKLARMLCRVLDTIEQEPGVVFDFGKEINAWWKEHKKQDELARKAQALQAERVRVAVRAMKKLTKKEREALGLRHPIRED